MEAADYGLHSGSQRLAPDTGPGALQGPSPVEQATAPDRPEGWGLPRSTGSIEPAVPPAAPADFPTAGLLTELRGNKTTKVPPVAGPAGTVDWADRPMHSPAFAAAGRVYGAGGEPDSCLASAADFGLVLPFAEKQAPAPPFPVELRVRP